MTRTLNFLQLLKLRADDNPNINPMFEKKHMKIPAMKFRMRSCQEHHYMCPPSFLTVHVPHPFKIGSSRPVSNHGEYHYDLNFSLPASLPDILLT